MAATAFDSMDKAVEVNVKPAVNNTQAKTTNATKPVVNSTASKTVSLKDKKFASALTNLDDAQVELRQELSTVTAKYQDALAEKNRATQNCKNLKKEIKDINKKMKNIDKSKKMINANMESST